MLPRSVFFAICQTILASVTYAAGSGETHIGIKARTYPGCSFSSASTALASQNMTLASSGIASSTVAITEMVDDATATLKAASIQLSLRASCNIPHRITLISAQGGLESDSENTSLNGAFLGKVGYQATAQWGSQGTTLITNGTPGQRSDAPAIVGPRAGDVNIEIKIDGTNNDTTLPVLAGSYSDTLTVHIGAPL